MNTISVNTGVEYVLFWYGNSSSFFKAQYHREWKFFLDANTTTDLGSEHLQ